MSNKHSKNSENSLFAAQNVFRAVTEEIELRGFAQLHYSM